MKIIQWACLLSFAPLLTSCNPGDPVEIPKVEEIAEMQIDIEGLNRVVSGYKSQEEEILKFSAPKEHWASILNAFQPYKRGTTWTKGYVPGDIILKLKDGASFRISVLVFGENDVIHPRLGPDFITHVGGSARELHDALKAAYAATQKKEEAGGD